MRTTAGFIGWGKWMGHFASHLMQVQHVMYLTGVHRPFSVCHKNRESICLVRELQGIVERLSSAFPRWAISFESVQTIGFILPSVYRKHTWQRIIPQHWYIVSITDVGRGCFTLDGKDYYLPTSFRCAGLAGGAGRLRRRANQSSGGE